MTSRGRGMISVSERWLNRLLALFGVDLDFNVDLTAERFSQISQSLYLGARPTPQHVAQLRAMGISHVVSALPDKDRSRMAFLQGAFDTLFVPLEDRMSENLQVHLAEFFRFSLPVVTSIDGRKIFIHCEAGVSRSASLAIALLMQQQDISFLQAFEAVRCQRPQVLPNIGFASQLQQLEQLQAPRQSAENAYSSLALYLHQACCTPSEIELIESRLHAHAYDALSALQSIFGSELPRVIQGVRN